MTAVLFGAGCADQVDLGQPPAGPTSSAAVSAGFGLPPPGAPDRIVVATGREIEVISSLDGDVLWSIANPIGEGDYEARFSADRASVYFLREFTHFADPNSRSGILRVRVGEDEPEELALESGLIHTFLVSPDDRVLAYSVSPSDGSGEGRPSHLVLVDLVSGERSLPSGNIGGSPDWSPDGRAIASGAARDGRFGIALTEVVGLGLGSERFLAPTDPQGLGLFWSAPRYEGGTGRLAVAQACCWTGEEVEPDEDYSTRWLVIDPATGEVLEELPFQGGDVFLLDFDSSGRHALWGLDPDEPCEHSCPAYLQRPDARGGLVELAVPMVDADW